MVTMTPLQQLTEKIYTALPDLKELGVGCEFIEFAKEKPPIEKFVVLKDNVDIYRTGNLFTQNDITYLGINATETYDSFIVNSKHFNHYKWLKDNQLKPITLTDVLRWMDGLGLTFAYHEYYAEVYNIEQLLQLWNLSEYNLNNQSQAVIDFLNNL